MADDRSLRAKLEAMARQTDSPREAEIARRKLEAMGPEVRAVPKPKPGGQWQPRWQPRTGNVGNTTTGGYERWARDQASKRAASRLDEAMADLRRQNEAVSESIGRAMKEALERSEAVGVGARPSPAGASPPPPRPPTRNAAPGAPEPSGQNIFGRGMFGTMFTGAQTTTTSSANVWWDMDGTARRNTRKPLDEGSSS